MCTLARSCAGHTQLGNCFWDGSTAVCNALLLGLRGDHVSAPMFGRTFWVRRRAGSLRAAPTRQLKRRVRNRREGGPNTQSRNETFLKPQRVQRIGILSGLNSPFRTRNSERLVSTSGSRSGTFCRATPQTWMTYGERLTCDHLHGLANGFALVPVEVQKTNCHSTMTLVAWWREAHQVQSL